MKLLHLTLPTAAENLALDEALLLECESSHEHGEALRVWEPAESCVVVGRSSKVEREVNLAACRRDGVPVLRRVSGGCAIVTAPGCLMYALVLNYTRRPELRAIHAAHRFVLDTLATMLARHAPGLERAGISDLALAGRKVSGNSLRCQRTHLLYHGTLLYGMQTELMERYLTMPPRQPDYRAGRRHADFLALLPATREQLVSALIDAFDAQEPWTLWPELRTRQLDEQRYTREDWNRYGK
jgi:lipoate-protein ligase A